MGSPITSWEGAKAIFTFANSPDVIGLILTLSVLVTLFAIVASIRHENHTYIDYME